MPELPEVETIKRGLGKLLPGKTIANVTFDNPKSFPNVPSDARRFIIGAKIVKVRRRAKMLMIELDSNYTLVIHLKMTGQLVYVRTRGSSVISHQSSVKKEDRKQNTEDSAPSERFGGGHPSDSLIGKLPDKSTRVIFDLTYQENVIGRTSHKAEQSVAKLFFNDQRKFGWVRLIPTNEVPNIDFFKKVGPEPLDSKFTSSEFINRLQKRKNTSIKAAILDQSVIAGIGNIYADESLWRAKIHPSSLVKYLSTRKLNKLFDEIRYVLKLSIAKGGSTDRNYVDAEGKKGSYLSFANVFRREGQDCPRCSAKIVKIRVTGRGTHICPKCQKEAQDK